ncbi:nudix hydrolase 2-like isoform X1 [Olea europaea subsp. europaea]|uniref:Nudix hydrolase 2-like isoform X1 n=2 Tax=Olea europaea subsp. europaea TaxID=158383 RepID=A0A8S0Q9H9_OLEEU|nr:nudix hydrolase 2-like isoform X1 [Olea europaea subsp. europaea]
MMACMKFASRSSILCFTTSRTIYLNSKIRPFSTVKQTVEDQGKLNKVRFGISLNSRFWMSSSSASHVSSEKQTQQVERILDARNDDHGGVMVEMTDESMDAGLFASLLRASLSQWRQQGKKGVWIKMPIELVNLVEPAVKEGFYYHHAEAKYIMLVHWLPSIANTLPASASHRVGIGAFVVNEKNEVLVVQEKSGTFGGTGVWKFPTGVVDEGEDICDAAVREVKEETGIDSKFVEILAFRYFPAQNHLFHVFVVLTIFLFICYTYLAIIHYLLGPVYACLLSLLVFYCFVYQVNSCHGFQTEPQVIL